MFVVGMCMMRSHYLYHTSENKVGGKIFIGVEIHLIRTHEPNTSKNRQKS